MDIGVYITNINTDAAFTNIKSDISRFLPSSEISIDLEDIDRVLRIEAEHVDSQKIIETVKKHRFNCKEMTY